MNTVRVRIFVEYKISRLSWIVLHPRNLILGYICTRDLKYTCVRIYEIICMSSGDDDSLDRILGGTVSDKLVAMTKSPQLTPGFLQNLLGVVLAPMKHAGSMA